MKGKSQLQIYDKTRIVVKKKNTGKKKKRQNATSMDKMVYQGEPCDLG